MLTTKQITLTLSLIAFMLSGVAYSQTEKWTFSSAEIVEKSRQDGKTLTKKTLKSEKEISDNVYFRNLPLQIEFFESSNDSVFANVQLRSGNINALVLQDDQTMILLSTANEVPSPEQSDRQNFMELIRFTDVKQSKGNITLKYNYLYVDIYNNNRIIDGVMTINYRKGEINNK